MDTELDFPPIEAPAAAPAPSTAVATQAAAELDLTTLDLETVALSAFGPASAAVATATAKLTGVQHDLSTPSKLADAKSLRHRLINVPLADARKTSAALKSKLTSVSKAVGMKLVAIESDFDAAEKLISPQIDAAQAKLDEEARIKREAEAARVQKHRDALDKLAEPAERCKQPDMTAARIANGIALVTAIELDEKAWEEFYPRAVEQKAVTLERMQALHAAAVATEEAARLAAEQAAQLKAKQEEADRKAAELQAEADRLAAAAADLARQQAEFAAQQAAAAAKAREQEELNRKRDEARRMEEEAARLGVTVERAPAAEVLEVSGEEAGPYRASLEDCQSEIMGIQQQVAIAISGRRGVRVGGTIECIRATLAETEALTIGDHLHIFKGAAQKAKDEAVAQIRQLLADAEAKTNTPEQASPQVLKAEAPAPDATDRDAPASTSPSVGSMGAGPAADAAPLAEVRTLTLGEIKARIAPLSIDAAGLESLGFPAVKVKAACMYRPSDLDAMLVAMRKVLE